MEVFCMRQRTFLEAGGVSTEQTRWTPIKYHSDSEVDGKKRQWYNETMRKLFPDVIVDVEGRFPPTIVERRRERERVGLQETLKSEDRRVKKSPIEMFLDFAGKVSVGQSVRLATCVVRRANVEEIVVSYPDTGMKKTIKHASVEHPDRSVEMVEIVHQDGSLEVRDTRIRFKDGVEDKPKPVPHFDPDFAPLSASMWFQYLCRTVKISDGTFQIEREIHAFERNVDHSKLGEICFRNLAAKLAYLQRVRNITPQTVIQQHLPVLLNYIDGFDTE
jgi:hypothetical protein